MRVFTHRVVIIATILFAAWPAVASTADESPSPSTERQGLARPETQIELRLPPDRVFSKSVGPDGAVVFSHGTHVTYAGDQCTGCHTGAFKILRPIGGTSHEDMNAGRSCGICHDGRQAFSTKDEGSCSLCHTGWAKGGEGSAASRDAPTGAPPSTREPAGAPPAKSAPAMDANHGRPQRMPGAEIKDISFPSSQASPGRVVFRHSTHGGEVAKCADCHPRLFAMRAGGTALTSHSVFHGEKCGGCHEGQRAFSVDDTENCQRCHLTKGDGS